MAICTVAALFFTLIGVYAIIGGFGYLEGKLSIFVVLGLAVASLTAAILLHEKLASRAKRDRQK
jgi:hypothetical protein